MSTKTWTVLGVSAAVALTLGGLWWALKGGPSSALATSSAPAGAGGPASSSASVADATPDRGPSQQSPDAGDRAGDFFSRGLAVLEGFGRSIQGGSA